MKGEDEIFWIRMRRFWCSGSEEAVRRIFFTTDMLMYDFMMGCGMSCSKALWV